VNYAMFTFDRSHPTLGRLRIFDMAKRAEDTIPDVRRPASANIDENAVTRPVIDDLLPAQDTWINTLWIGLDYTGIAGLEIDNILKHEIYHQMDDDPRDPDGRSLRGNSSFTGLINKVDYSFDAGSLNLRPRVKSEYFRQTPFRREEDKRQQWTGMGILLTQLPVFSHTLLQGGLELLWQRELVQDEDEMLDLGLTQETGDLSSVTLAVQLSNTSDYLGYRLTTQIGLRYGSIATELIRQRTDGSFAKRSERTTETTSFLTILAGL